MQTTRDDNQPTLAEVHADTYEATCRICRQNFKATRLELLGATLSATICHECGARFEQREKENELERRQRELARSARAREEAWSKICPVEFRSPNEADGRTLISTLELNQPKVKELLNWDGQKGIIIRGATGKCKTRAMWRLVRRLYVNGKHVMVLTAGQFDRQCRDAAGNFTITQWFDRLARCDVFVMDDLGQGSWTQATEATWLDLVDERTRESRPIIVTTQHTGQSLTDSASEESRKLLRAEAMIRRLREYCDTIVFT